MVDYEFSMAENNNQINIFVSDIIKIVYSSSFHRMSTKHHDPTIDTEIVFFFIMIIAVFDLSFCPSRLLILTHTSNFKDFHHHIDILFFFESFGRFYDFNIDFNLCSSLKCHLSMIF